MQCNFVTRSDGPGLWWPISEDWAFINTVLIVLLGKRHVESTGTGYIVGCMLQYEKRDPRKRVKNFNWDSYILFKCHSLQIEELAIAKIRNHVTAEYSFSRLFGFGTEHFVLKFYSALFRDRFIWSWVVTVSF